VPRNETICHWRHAGSGPRIADLIVAGNRDHADHDFSSEFPQSGTLSASRA
jgi:hypothetical protein